MSEKMKSFGDTGLNIKAYATPKLDIIEKHLESSLSHALTCCLNVDEKCRIRSCIQHK